MKKINLFNMDTLLFFLLRAPYIGMCSNTLIQISKQDSWISILISIILGFIPMYLYYKIITKYPSKNIIKVINLEFGKVLGTIINIILGLFITLFITIIFWNLISFIGSQYLYKTPDLVIAIVFAIALLYMINKGLICIVRSSCIFFYISIFLCVLSILGLGTQLKIDNLLPIMEYGLNPILKGVFSYTAFNILPLFIVTIIPFNMYEKQNDFKKHFFFTYIFSSLSLLLIIVYILCIYGPNLSNLMQYPEFHLLKRLSLIGFIERFENILSLQWVFDMFVYSLFGLYYISQLFLELFKKVKIKKKNIVINTIITILLVIFSLIIFKTNTEGDNFIMKTLPTYLYIFFLGLPTFILLKKVILDV